MEQIGYSFTCGMIRAIAVFSIALLVFTAATRLTFRYFSIGYDETDNKATGERSGLRIYTDHATGCQYIATSNGNLTPRINADGAHICKEPTP
ncbi:DUF6440 family protein [Novosphingobium sp. Leaf2]|uniref:DUF6440 family protein n=1 Tax=Novosphingobium sp. Leaf2 TaxID=1735670 RepID=UPI0006F46E40|nr:DUF6440 family protein [Novosphingobium sp. Leaf2]KQM18414.1 hypothetical protein ASE49_09390 [Novosphingobium sp. Leaf2]